MKKKKKPKTTVQEFQMFCDVLQNEDKALINDYFEELKYHTQLSPIDNKLIKQDFENAILYLYKQNLEISEILKRLDLINLGGFYARPSSLWLEMDDVAKMYSLFMKRDSMGVFRLSCYLKKDVIPELLQIALLFTVKRFPSFAVTLKKGFFWNYLDSQKKRFQIEKEKSIPCQPINVSISGSQTFRVIYYNNKISVEFFHGMTDGSGGLIFLKALVKEYLILNGINIPKDDTVFDINDVPETEEYENAFRKIKLQGKTNELFNKSALQLGGRLTNKKPCRIIHFKMDTDKLKEVTKKYNTTVTSYIISILFIASKASIDDIKGDISVCCPINLRKYFDSKTIRNYSVFSSVRIPIDKVSNISSLIPYLSEEIKTSTTKEKLLDILSSTVGITQKIGIIPLFLKQPVIKIGYLFIGDNQFTTTLSNLGSVKLPKEMENEIESMDFVLGTAVTNRAVTSLISVSNTSTLTISKLTKDPSFEEEIYTLLKNDGIEPIIEGSEAYED